MAALLIVAFGCSFIFPRQQLVLATIAAQIE
jgi:hypothetical protein